MLDKGQKAAAEPVAAPAIERLGRYELIARIADGGMAEVYLARQLGPMNFQKVVVVKKIHPNLARQKEFIGMLLDEARISALIKHPRVVDIYDLGVSKGIYFIAMEFLSGQPLSNVVARGRAKNALDVYSTARIIADAAEGLHAAHNLKTLSGRALELVHRDVSPSNIIVLYDGNVKLVDFGVAKARGRITETDANQIKGKVGYVSPEQIMESPADRRSDVFALGVVMWEALALRRLFDAESEAGKLKQILDGVPLPPSAHRPEVPYELDKICLRALAVKPDDRWQSAGELQSAIESFLRDANYRREAAAVARYMTETFVAERQREEELLRQVADADRAGASRRAKGPAPKAVTERVRSASPAATPMPPRVDVDRDTTQTEEGDVITATSGPPPPVRRDERDVDTDTGVRTFVHRPGEVSSLRIGEHARVARAQVLAPGVLAPPRDSVPGTTPGTVPGTVPGTGADTVPGTGAGTIPGTGVGTVADTVPGSVPGTNPTGSTKVMGSALRPVRPASRKKILRADTAETTVPGEHPALSDPDGMITQLPTTKPRGKKRTTGRNPIRETLPGVADATHSLRASSSRILPLPAPPRVEAPTAGPDQPFEDSDDDDEAAEVDITEVDSSVGRKFEDLLSIGAAPPVPVVPMPAAEQPPLAPPRPVALPMDAATEIEEVVELSQADIIIPLPVARRRLWIVGVVAVGASALVALSVVWALDASSRAAPRDTREIAETGQTDDAPRGAQQMPFQDTAPEPTNEPVGAAEPPPPAAEPPPPAAESPPAAEPSPAPPKERLPRPPVAATAVPPPRKKVPAGTDSAAGAGSAPAAPAASPSQLYREGAQLTLAGRLAEAQKKYIAALRISPGYAPALRGLGLVYEKSGQKAKAIKSLQAYLRLAPKAADAAAIRARIERLRN